MAQPKAENVTFLNQARADSDFAGRADFGVIGACFDGGSAAPGVNRGPARAREVADVYANVDGSAQPIKIFNPERGYLLDGVQIVDFGDIECSRELRAAGDAIERVVRRAVKLGIVPITLGGDHFVTYPCIGALDSKVTVVHFDAHSDYLDDESCPHGSFMRWVAALPNVSRIIHCGLRGNLNCGSAIQASLARGNALITTTDLERRGVRAIAESLPPGEPIYVTFDVDVLDPSAAPGTGTHEPGGISYALARDLLIATCQRGSVKGVDFTEYNPELDWNDVTGKAVVNLMIEVMGAVHKAGGGRGALS